MQNHPSQKNLPPFRGRYGTQHDFHYLGDGKFYGIHAEECPTPVFRFKKEQGNFTYDQLGDQDTHDYAKGDILYMVPCDESVWDTVKIDGKSLEEVLQNSYIVNIS